VYVKAIAIIGKEANAYKGKLRSILKPAYIKKPETKISKILCRTFFAVNIKEKISTPTENLKTKIDKLKLKKLERKESVWFSTILYPYSFNTLNGKRAPFIPAGFIKVATRVKNNTITAFLVFR
jgi:hypothetical protein